MVHGAQRLYIRLDGLANFIGHFHCLLDLVELATALSLSNAHVVLKFISWSEPNISFHSFYKFVLVNLTTVKLLVQIEKRA